MQDEDGTNVGYTKRSVICAMGLMSPIHLSASYMSASSCTQLSGDTWGGYSVFCNRTSENTCIHDVG
jgi:hypothetical protein